MPSANTRPAARPGPVVRVTLARTASGVGTLSATAAGRHNAAVSTGTRTANGSARPSPVASSRCGRATIHPAASAPAPSAHPTGRVPPAPRPASRPPAALPATMPARNTPMTAVHVSRLDPTSGASSRPAASCNTNSPALAASTAAPHPTGRLTSIGELTEAGGEVQRAE